MKITVFTPAYNRAYTLERLYDSLTKQTYQNFEWLVIDDGSTDNTHDLIKSFIDQNKIDIRYHKTPNGGKPRAINMGTDLAKGDIFFIVDSDDYLTPNALERVRHWFNSIKGQTKIAGVSGSRGYTQQELIGTTFQGEHTDALHFDRSRLNISGDKAEAFYTHILKNYKFKEFPGEKFITEATVWYKLAEDGYKLRYFNEIIYICDYLQDGLTKNATKLRRNNINGTLHSYKYLMSLKQLPLNMRLRYLLNYLRFSTYKILDKNT